jgi:phage baseplate assembly protein W
MIRRQDDGGSWPLEHGPGEPLSPVARTARLVLEVVPGERRLLPEFGCRVHQLPAITTDADRRLAAALIEEALDAWVPSLRIDRADVTSVENGAIAVVLRARGAAHALTIAHRHRDAAAPRADGAAAPEGDLQGSGAGWMGRRP